jgi:hypothetical protein
VLQELHPALKVDLTSFHKRLVAATVRSDTTVTLKITKYEVLSLVPHPQPLEVESFSGGYVKFTLKFIIVGVKGGCQNFFSVCNLILLVINGHMYKLRSDRFILFMLGWKGSLGGVPGKDLSPGCLRYTYTQAVFLDLMCSYSFDLIK